MCPGDVLYIPRGHMHNASTVVFDRLKRKWKDWDNCPTYPEGLVSADPLAGRIDKTPSMHLTLGITSDLTVEALLHFAMYDYFEDERGIFKNGMVIPPNTCSSRDNRQKATGYHVDWERVLRHSLAEVARREGSCDNPSYRGVPAGMRGECDNAVLRRLVPLLLLTNNEFDESGSSVTARVDRRIRTAALKKSYLRALDEFGSSASVGETAQFVRSHVLETCDCPDRAFDYPGYRKYEDAILCPDELGKASESEFSDLLHDFIQYARDDFSRALRRMNLEGQKVRAAARERQQMDLERVDQGSLLL